MVAAVLGIKINLGNSAIPGIRYKKNIKLATTIGYIAILLITVILYDSQFELNKSRV